MQQGQEASRFSKTSIGAIFGILCKPSGFKIQVGPHKLWICNGLVELMT